MILHKINIEFTAKYGGEVIITSGWLSDDNWQSIEFPKTVKDNIKLRYACMIDGKYYCIPQGMPEVGAIVAVGDTVQDVLDKIKDIADKIKGYDLCMKIEKLDETLESISKMEKSLNMKF